MASLFLSTESVSQGHLDLTELIGVPLPSSVSFVTGYGGFPAYSFGPGANVGRPARTLIPSTFFRDFAISVTVKPASTQGGVLFAITDAFQKIIYLGLRLSGVEDGHQRVILYYTEPGSQVSHEAAAFSLPVMTHRWNRFAVIVQGEDVTLFMDCEEHSHILFQRSPQALAFEPSAGIFVGNAGATGLERFISFSATVMVSTGTHARDVHTVTSGPSAFPQGSIQQLTIHPDPRTPEELCEAEESSASGETSGLQEPDEVAEILEAITYTQAPSKEAEVAPISTPPAPSLLSGDTELSGEPVPEGTPETTNLSIAQLNSPEQGSGEILNDTLDGVHTVDGDSVTDVGSGSGALLNVTEDKELAASAAGEAEVPVSTTEEAEANSVPARGPTLSLSTQSPEEATTMGPDNEEGLAITAAGEAEVPVTPAEEEEAGSGFTEGPALALFTQNPEEESTLVRNRKCWELRSWQEVATGSLMPIFFQDPNGEESLATSAAPSDVSLSNLQEEESSGVPTDGLAFLTPTGAPVQEVTSVSGDEELTAATTEGLLTSGGGEEPSSAPPEGPPLPIPTAAPERVVTLVSDETEGSGLGWGSDIGSGSGDLVGSEDLLRVTAFSDMGDMLQKAHLVIEGTFIYLRDSAEFFLRVRDGWKKLQLGELIPIPADSPPPPALASNVSSFPALLLAAALPAFPNSLLLSSPTLSKPWMATSV
ncbi:Collagen alpha-1(XV) chain [Tupaia chinensis]|uniref:Collagen alpha-1(XV) chain n=1 Tax=Tupaia chinensis TaxID=246437 RepID=L8YCK7_TUPCH|nr:Collagen alpha-1(XV) chain [Tupaia chinensis]